jgi:hypothetical protein
MRAFYWTLIRKMPALLWSASERWITFSAIIGFLATLFNRQIGGKVNSSWHAISPWWSLVPVWLLFIYGIARSNYDRFCGLESELNGRVETLKAENSRLLSEIHESQKPRRSEFQEKRFQHVKSCLERYDQDEKLLLAQLVNCQKMYDYPATGLCPIPTTISCERAAVSLQKMEPDQIVMRHPEHFGGGMYYSWTIYPGIQDDLMCLL